MSRALGRNGRNCTCGLLVPNEAPFCLATFRWVVHESNVPGSGFNRVLSPEQLTTHSFCGSPYGVRTRVSGLKDQKSFPLDERAKWLRRSPHPESNRSPLSTKQVLCRMSFEGGTRTKARGVGRLRHSAPNSITAPAEGIEPPDRSVNSRLPYHLATPERWGWRSTPARRDPYCQTTAAGACDAAVVPGAGIEPALTGSEAVVLPS